MPRPRWLVITCGELITDAKDGNYQRQSLLLEDGACMMVFTHKRCCEAFERTQENREGWQAIPPRVLRHSYYLAQNLHVTWKTSQAIARLDDVLPTFRTTHV